LPATSSQKRIGDVSNCSSVPERSSPASDCMVVSGVKNPIISASQLKTPAMVTGALAFTCGR
jgi:hypothetical protein